MKLFPAFQTFIQLGSDVVGISQLVLTGDRDYFTLPSPTDAQVIGEFGGDKPTLKLKDLVVEIEGGKERQQITIVSRHTMEISEENTDN